MAVQQAAQIVQINRSVVLRVVFDLGLEARGGAGEHLVVIHRADVFVHPRLRPDGQLAEPQVVHELGEGQLLWVDPHGLEHHVHIGRHIAGVLGLRLRLLGGGGLGEGQQGGHQGAQLGVSRPAGL